MMEVGATRTRRVNGCATRFRFRLREARILLGTERMGWTPVGN